MLKIGSIHTERVDARGLNGPSEFHINVLSDANVIDGITTSLLRKIVR